MKRTLVLVALLLLSLSSLAWAEGNPAAGPANGGRCVLPDLSGLSPDQAAAAVIQAGLQMSPTSTAATIPACPSTFRCSDIAGCGASMACFGFGIGPCCSTGAAVVCCGNGSNILVVSCPCKCVDEDCPRQCGQSSQLTWSCS